MNRISHFPLPAEKSLLGQDRMKSSSFSPMLLWSLFIFFVFLSPSLSLPFSPPGNVTLFGDAHFRNNTISLTQEPPCSPFYPSCGVGRALYAYPIRFLDPTTNSVASFTSTFSFSITPSFSSLPGDGLAFLITSNVDTGCSSAGYMGLTQCNKNQGEPFIAVEFDTSLDSSLGDLNDNHVGLDINTVASFASVDVGSIGIDLKSGRRIRAWVDYKDAEKMIRIWVGYSRVRPPNPLLTSQVDLSRQYKEFMHVGFSASNGRGSALHLVEQWEFRTSGLVRPKTMPLESDTSQDSACFTCNSADDSDDNNGSPNVHRRRRMITDIALGLGGAVGFLFSMGVTIGAIIWYVSRKRRIDGRGTKTREMCRIQMNKVPTRLSLAKIKSATKGFKESRIVGKGASGTVYQGQLGSGRTVAVKRFSGINQVDRFRDPFTTELATMLGCLRHKNLVQLQGWCCEGNELVLVYEFLPRGSLDKILHKSSSSAVVLKLDQRLKIVLGVASALTYLHEECERQIIHRDVKACNIMLDAEFNAKLGDFGLAEVYEHSGITRVATIPAGTMGYLAPEYVHTGIPTVKTDVYSFGVVVLEVATGRQPVDDNGIALTDWTWDMWLKGKLIEAVDGRLEGRFDKAVVERMLMVGISCTHPNSVERPTVKEAARILRGEAPLPVLPTRKPVLRMQSALPQGYEEILHRDDGSVGLSDTPWLTPRTHMS
ncbi:PREDICTED: L-type lectin-domain containing receptor kinase S.6 [Nelumbo nucifera]|uniref:non-specific serine/threonine protein kinase n=2 Tax=Nelumbo nucifera TaxID=4432 RepID=A0A1U7ZGL1_NELNU|nr:PREDICTED: L-type lectin-domain containing receptor kinase S.6 [Nelumbo nucifera]DAD39993.1 TPA_asm: hypothetical protein HUJ06_014316 [Nelumbo nucifera]